MSVRSSLSSNPDAADMSMELPPDASGDEGASDSETNPCAFDDDNDWINAEDEQRELLELCQECCQTLAPTPAAASNLLGFHDVCEFYSPPRVCTSARQQGLVALLSCDLLTGWDFRESRLRRLSVDLLIQLRITFVMLCPPCTIFSVLQRVWNFKYWTQEVIDFRWNEGVTFVDHSMLCARIQHEQDRYFAFEHPYRSGAWDLESVQYVSRLSGVHVFDFDMCLLGLTSKVSGLPMRKRTRLMTNVPGLASALRGRFCDGSHGDFHQVIQGFEGGVSRSSWAQTYPRSFCDLVAREVANLQR